MPDRDSRCSVRGARLREHAEQKQHRRLHAQTRSGGPQWSLSERGIMVSDQP